MFFFLLKHISFAYLTVICYHAIFLLRFSSLDSRHITAVASKLLNSEFKLVTAENEEGLTALQMLAQFCEFS